jgi:hypothetical protein
LSFKTKVYGFHSLCLKTDNSGLVIWASKSSRQFLILGFKTSRATVCWLCHKTNRRRSISDTRRYLAACFTLNQIGLWFSSLALRLVEARLWLVYVALSRRSRGIENEDGCVNVMGCVRPFYPKIIIFIILGLKGIIVF